MKTLDAGQEFPRQQVARLGGDTLTLGAPAEGRDWQMIVVYRGLHCPICKSYLKKLEEVKGAFHEIGVDVVTVSGDPEEKALAMAEETGSSVPMGYGLDIAQMRALGLFVSDPRSPEETDRPFPEPGLFVVNAEGRLQIVDISNAPFARPDLGGLAKGLAFVREKGYPIRGTHAAA
ncbi:redoxin domain-containing protein [Roseovarius aquimarinus]|uniref:Redoxin domain-containing protein n=1 Tax=Roseovarius aquimarinus TaxID=1229156 RepID=A0ABW7I519_9RHOB